MRDVLGWRAKFGVLGPSTNTIVQPDFEMMRPPGVTNHYSRIFTPNADAVNNDTFMAGTQLIGEKLGRFRIHHKPAIESVAPEITPYR